ncbi:MAG: hypothetical protein ACYSUI_10825 [Planctomycetota bacterium]
MRVPTGCCLALGIVLVALAGTARASDSVTAQEAVDRLQAQVPQVRFYHEGQRLTRVYGVPLGFGTAAEYASEQFRLDHAEVFGVEPEDLEPIGFAGEEALTLPLVYDRHTGEYKFTLIRYGHYEQGIPVFQSDMRVLVLNREDYPVVLVSSSLRDLGGFTPAIEPGAARADLGQAAAKVLVPDLINFTEPEMVIWAGIEDMDVEPRVALTFVADNYTQGEVLKPERWRFVTDATTGSILYQENLIVFTDVTGNVSGIATQGVGAYPCDPDESEPMRYARVTTDTATAYADVNGDFVIPNAGTTPVEVESRVWGEWFRVFNVQSGGTDAVLARTVTPPGPADFTHNGFLNNEYYRAQVNGYVEANVVRDYTLAYSPAFPGLQQNAFPVNVNEDPGVGYCPCNAWWDGNSITFCRSDPGCVNTAWSSVVHHEYGHHLVGMSGNGQGPYGEGTGDVMSLLVLDDSRIGVGFPAGNCGAWLRDADNNCQYQQSGCSSCGSASHDCGRLLAGCVWSTRTELLATEPTEYRNIISNLAINAMFLHSGSSITPSITIDYLTLDDDDGDIANGTPHYAEIDAGFGAHNMAAPPLSLVGFEYPDGRPELATPGESTVFGVNVVPIAGTPVPGSGELHYSLNGGSFATEAMSEFAANEYEATLPAAACLDVYTWYVSADAAEGGTYTDPSDAPASTHTSVVATNQVIVFADDFETNQGWTVSGTASDGQWDRGVPVACNRGDPPTDFDGSGQCYLTDNSSASGCNSDVDGGYTRLHSPTIDLSGGDAEVHYALWYTNDYGADPNNDLFHVHVSNNNGSNWTLVQTFGPLTTSGWTEHAFVVSSFVPPTAQVVVRFEASDLSSGSVVEAAVDDFSVSRFECEAIATCDDGTQNQGEEMIDCGGPECPPCECLSDPTCADGAFCNGSETCDAFGDCQAGSDPCGAGSWCDETGDGCIAYGNGDFDVDLDVDLDDFEDFQKCFGQSALGGCEPGNLSGDGMIDLDDFQQFAAGMGGPS